MISGSVFCRFGNLIEFLTTLLLFPCNEFATHLLICCYMKQDG